MKPDQSSKKISVLAVLEPPSLGQKVGLFRYLVGRDMEADEALFQRALDRGVSLSHVLHFVGDGPGESKKTNLPFEPRVERSLVKKISKRGAFVRWCVCEGK